MTRRMERSATDYSGVTEVPGLRTTLEAISMLQTRYKFAASLCADKRVLEVACGAGLGLGCLARRARLVVGGDCTFSLISRAQGHYQGRIPLVRFDGQRMPFEDASFDVVVLFEAIYYFSRPDMFLTECRRVLVPGGTLLICTANPEWTGFNPSPFSKRYFSANQLGELLAASGFPAQMFGAFPASAESRTAKIVGLIRRMAVRMHLFPKTMSGKEVLKRVFYGQLVEVQGELEETPDTVQPFIPISSNNGNVTQYKIIYAVSRVEACVSKVVHA